jgi:putative transposase
MRSLAAKVPTDLWPEFKARAAACYQAPLRAIAANWRRESAPNTRTSCRARSPASRTTSRRASPLRLPVTHRRFIRTTNLLERLFVEERRRSKIIPNGFGEKPVLELMFGALIRATGRWRGLRTTEFDLRQIPAVRKKLDQEYEASMTPLARSSQTRASTQIGTLT